MEISKRVKVEIEAIESIEGLKLIRPKIFPDDRGFFSETYNLVEWSSELNFSEIFKQDNHSFSKHNVIRGLHSQPGMGKLVSVVSGKIFDVAVDIRPNSNTFGKWHGEILDGKSGTRFWIPDGFLHGFYTMSEEGAHVIYKCTDVYNPKTEFGINLFDENINIKWPFDNKNQLIISDRDKNHPKFSTLNIV
ncbi:unnamed protein product [Dracunculus medinensis]|uniref:Thymidine diphospho-4-keto-rhamnose 3,5-epimerase n=1 Tax=Dracunculus medinensis TaxID=318479 RepID=A0A0N4U6J2_DRAME|nr:unnamed protein product [Dracunculus medinensis]